MSASRASAPPRDHLTRSAPRLWAVERTFSWFGRNRRLTKDFENLAEILTTFATLASIQLALRRLAKA
jgi:transposase